MEKKPEEKRYTVLEVITADKKEINKKNKDISNSCFWLGASAIAVVVSSLIISFNASPVTGIGSLIALIIAIFGGSHTFSELLKELVEKTTLSGRVSRLEDLVALGLINPEQLMDYNPEEGEKKGSRR